MHRTKAPEPTDTPVQKTGSTQPAATPSELLGRTQELYRDYLELSLIAQIAPAPEPEHLYSAYSWSRPVGLSLTSS